ncbi:MAG: FliI/YscN family ATPase [Sulfitobacter sp.]
MLDHTFSDPRSVFDALSGSLKHAPTRPICGTVSGLRGMAIAVEMAGLALGQTCAIMRPAGAEPLLADVAALTETGGMLMPYGSMRGIVAGALVRPLDVTPRIAVGAHLLGRVLDGLGRDLVDPFSDALARAAGPDAIFRPLRAAAPDPMGRPLINTALSTGIHVIDSMTTLGRGQRVGIFGSPGTGKSTLIAAIARNTDAEVIVIGLVGERGREVREFLERDLPAEKRSQVIVVASTSDRPAIERLYAAHTATAVAEGFRDQGKDVLLILDSLTRVARALREIGLATGEAPTRRGYPASVYPALPELIERAGTSPQGSITALYTVLQEGDGEGDPIAEEVKSLTDGHITLSQDLADAGHYPAIDPRRSLSRLMTSVASAQVVQTSRKARALMAKYEDIRLLVEVGEYKPGVDLLADEAVEKVPLLQEAFRQDLSEPVTIRDAGYRLVVDALS